MGSLSKKVPYLHDNFLLSASQFTASSQGNGKFTEFVRLHGADYLPEVAKVLPADIRFHIFTKVFLPIRFFAHSLKFSSTKVFHYTVFSDCTIRKYYYCIAIIYIIKFVVIHT